MHLQESSKARLTDRRLDIVDYGDMYQIFKPIEAGGNSIPNWAEYRFNEDEEPDTDAPYLEIRIRNDKWNVKHWDYIPGPGPGDFSLFFEKESEAIDFVISYFFEENKYFNEKKMDELGLL